MSKKIFVFGSKSINKLPEAFIEYIDKHIYDGDTFLIGDCYGVDAAVQRYLADRKYEKVKVYTSCSLSEGKGFDEGILKGARRNLGNWEEVHILFENKPKTYAFNHEKDIAMIDECDEGLGFWDGKSRATLDNINRLKDAGKTCNYFRNMAEKEEFLFTFFYPFSQEMGEHLEQFDLNDEKKLQIIKGAPVPLLVKRDWLKRLSKGNVIFKNALKAVSAVLASLENADKGMVFTLEDCWYDEDIFEEKNHLVGTFLSLDAAIDRIHREEKEYTEMCEQSVPEDEYPTWWKLKQWHINADGSSDDLYSFYLIHDEVCWFELMDSDGYPDEVCWFELVDSAECHGGNQFLRSSFLELPIPFEVGDIVEINTYPFGPKQAGIIFDFADVNDSIVGILTRGYKGDWYKGSLLHKLLGHSLYQDDRISPLFRLKRWKDDICGADGLVYMAVAEFVDGDREKGRQLWNAINETYKDTFSEKEILEIIDKCKRELEEKTKGDSDY